MQDLMSHHQNKSTFNHFSVVGIYFKILDNKFVDQGVVNFQKYSLDFDTF